MSSTSPATPEPVLVLGLGNVLCADDGLGIAAAVALVRGYELPPAVRVLDGGTLGLALMSELRGARRVILLDAIAADRPPGSLIRLSGGEVGPAVRERLSVHQVGVADLIESLDLIGETPPELTLLGLVPANLELGIARSPVVEAALPTLVRATVRELARLGHKVRPRKEVRRARDPEAVFLDTAGRAARVGLL